MEHEIIHKSALFDLGFQHGTPARWTITFKRDRFHSKILGRDPGRPEYFSTVGHALSFVTDRAIRLDPELKAVSDHLTALRQEIKEIGSRVIIL